MPVNLIAPDASALAPIAGVELGVAQAGIRKAGRTDTLVMRFAPDTTAAGVFTRNRFCAAPVRVCREHLAATGGRLRALVVNTGNANAGTGARGLADARRTCERLAAELGVDLAEATVLNPKTSELCDQFAEQYAQLRKHKGVTVGLIYGGKSFGPQRDMLEVAANFLEFFADESCGQCTPCREGNVKLALAMFIALGFFVGGFIGATLAHKIEPTLMIEPPWPAARIRLPTACVMRNVPTRLTSTMRCSVASSGPGADSRRAGTERRKSSAIGSEEELFADAVTDVASLRQNDVMRRKCIVPPK